MIRFVIASPLPKELTESDLRRLGQFLGRSLRIRKRTEVGVRFVAPSVIQRLNKAYRQINRPTDVLSFQDAGGKMQEASYLGDLAVCPSYARGEAKRRKVDVREELLRLLAHGVLHLRGYDHATASEERRMFGIQERVVAAMST